MASSAKSTSSELTARVAAELEAALSPGAHLLLGLSGGIDSVSLLHILKQLSPRLQFSLGAVHVHHGISPNADDWAGFCESLCRELAVPLAVERVNVGRFSDLGPEGAARAARYEAFASHECDFLALAQHRDDQAETLLLQLLRGAGVLGLSGMPPVRPGRETHKGVLRPLLGASRAEIKAFAAARSLQWIQGPKQQQQRTGTEFHPSAGAPAMRNGYRMPKVHGALGFHLGEGANFSIYWAPGNSWLQHGTRLKFRPFRPWGFSQKHAGPIFPRGG